MTLLKIRVYKVHKLADNRNICSQQRMNNLFKILLLALLAMAVTLTATFELTFAIITAIAVAALAIIVTLLYRVNAVEASYNQIK